MRLPCHDGHIDYPFKKMNPRMSLVRNPSGDLTEEGVPSESFFFSILNKKSETDLGNGSHNA